MIATTVDAPPVSQPPLSARPIPPPRPTGTVWPTTRLSRNEARQLLTEGKGHGNRNAGFGPKGIGLLLDWLDDQPGRTWQDRWLASGAETGDRAWRHIPTGWLTERGHTAKWTHEAFFATLFTAIAVDMIRPSLPWLVRASFQRGHLMRILAGYRDPEGFSQLRELCSADADISTAAATRTTYRTGLILAAKGGTISDITLGDIVELLEAEADHCGTKPGATHLFYRILHALCGFGPTAPATLRQLRAAGQRSPDELIDRFQISCRPVRDLLVDYLRERQPALDYASLVSLAGFLGNLFWADLERHHPGISSLHLSAEIAAAWKQRLRTITKTTRAADGTTDQVTVERINFRECLTPVRAFYLDLAHWAVEDPGRWGPWVVPCPVGSEEISRRKEKRHRKSRMDTRTRERLPVLPALVNSVHLHRRQTAALLDAARATAPGQPFTACGQTLIRNAPPRSAATKVWTEDPTTGQRRDLAKEEGNAFWAFAAVEVLRTTGIRIEELTELSHHSLIQYRLPTTGEVVPLLQITPSKTDAERLLVVSPELAEVLSAVISRVRGTGATVPFVSAYDRECTWTAPRPLLFQRRYGYENRAVSAGTVRDLLAAALHHSGLTDPVSGDPLRFTPHDFRRLFITDAIVNGLPPHIAQVIAGHRDINVTLGYKAVYPDEAIQSHLAFLARRRSLRPSDEYRVPSDEEWQQFLGHFERRKVSIGTCGRAFGSACVHEHACVRCALLWPDPEQRPRLVEIRDNLTARIAEAEREGWLGEVEGLQISLAAAGDKLARIDRRRSTTTTELGNPSLRADS